MWGRPLLQRTVALKTPQNISREVSYALFLLVGVLISHTTPSLFSRMLFVGVDLSLLLIYVRWYEDPGSMRRWWGWPAIYLLILVVGFNACYLSTDAGDYAAISQLIVRYRGNPFLDSASSVAGYTGDAFLNLAVWPQVKGVYGPAWYLLVSGFRMLSASPVWFFIVLKSAAALAHLLAALLAGRLAHQWLGQEGSTATRLYLMNPILLIELVASGHNDFAWLLLVLLSLAFLYSGRTIISSLTAGTALLFKTSPVVWVPLYLTHVALTKGKEWVPRIVLAAALVIVVGYSPFWSGLETLSGLRDISGNVSADNYTALTFFYRLTSAFAGVETAAAFLNWARMWWKPVMLLPFSLLYLRTLRHAIQRRKVKPVDYFTTMGLFLAFVSTWNQTWYLSWLVVFAVVGGFWRRYLWLWIIWAFAHTPLI